MNKGVGTSRMLVVAFAIVTHLLLCSASYAGDYGGEGFSLRFPAALTRFSTYADVAGGGGASAASKWSTSINPASADWQDLEGEYGVSVCPQWSRLSFDNGTDIDVIMESVTYNSEDHGTFVVGAAQISSNEETQRDGVDFEFSGDMFLVQWGKRIEDSAIGVALSYTRSEVLNGLMLSIPIAKSMSESYLLRVGGLHQVTEKWRGGVVVEYGWSTDRTDMLAVPAFGWPQSKVNDNTHQILLRPGVAFDYMEDGSIYVDYQYGAFWNDTGSLNVHRLFAGVDHGFTEYLFGRVGTALDTDGGLALTAGIGFYPTDWFSVDASYQNDMFPEIEQEFGDADTITLSVAFTF